MCADHPPKSITRQCQDRAGSDQCLDRGPSQTTSLSSPTSLEVHDSPVLMNNSLESRDDVSTTGNYFLCSAESFMGTCHPSHITRQSHAGAAERCQRDIPEYMPSITYITSLTHQSQCQSSGRCQRDIAECRPSLTHRITHSPEPEPG